MKQWINRVTRGSALAVVAVLVGAGGVLYAQEAAGPKPVLDTVETMTFFFDEPFHELQEAMAKEPASRTEWRGIYRATFKIAEATNLLFHRNSHDYESTEEWKQLTVKNRETAEALGATLRDRNYVSAKAAYETMVQSCNACHQRFSEDAPVLEAYHAPEAPAAPAPAPAAPAAP